MLSPVVARRVVLASIYPGVVAGNTDGLSVQFVGSGDAFGSAGRFQACISLRWSDAHALVDCGASSLIALKRLGLEPLSVDAILISHLHGDHFGGVPFLVLDQQFRRRERPLVVAGPPGLSERVLQAMEVLFPGSTQVQRRFELRVLELPERSAMQLGSLEVTAVPVVHASGAPAYGLRLRAAGKLVAYTGDTEWTDALVELAAGADLFIAEAYVFDKPVKYHLSYATFEQHRARLECERIILTHCSTDVLERRATVNAELAEDGLLISL
jgi:ribonuclease BN (tRNA processing enzyme)